MKYIINYGFISKQFTNLDFIYKMKLKLNFNVLFSLAKLWWDLAISMFVVEYNFMRQIHLQRYLVRMTYRFNSNNCLH